MLARLPAFLVMAFLTLTPAWAVTRNGTSGPPKTATATASPWDQTASSPVSGAPREISAVRESGPSPVPSEAPTVEVPPASSFAVP